MRPNEATMEAPKPTLAAVLEKENLNRAWEGVRANKGAPGPDGRDIASSQAHMRGRRNIFSVNSVRLIEGC